MGSPIRQMTCTSGYSNCKHMPSSIQCYNRGTDGVDVQVLPYMHIIHIHSGSARQIWKTATIWEKQRYLARDTIIQVWTG